MGNCGVQCINSQNHSNDLRKTNAEKSISSNKNKKTKERDSISNPDYQNSMSQRNSEYMYTNGTNGTFAYGGSSEMRSSDVEPLMLTKRNNANNLSGHSQEAIIQWENYQKSKRNNHLFLKDYSTQDYTPFILNSFAHIPSMTMLNEQKQFLVDTKLSTEDKIAHIEMKLSTLLNPEQSLIVVGNKIVKIDTPLDHNSYTKLIIEVKFAQFQQPLSKKLKPKIIISQPILQIQQELQQLLVYNTSNVNIVDTLIDSFTSGKYEGSMFMKMEKDKRKKDAARQGSQIAQIKGPIFGDPKNTINTNLSSKFSLFSTSKSIKVKESNQSQLRKTTQEPIQIIEEDTPDNFLVIDGEIQYHSSKCAYPKVDKIKSKSGEGNNQIPIWHEAFILYYKKEFKSDEEQLSDKGNQKQDQQFSIEISLHQKGKRKQIIGQKKTFMLHQFQNEKVYEQEIGFGTIDQQQDLYKNNQSQTILPQKANNQGSFHTSFQRMDTSKVKLHIKVQLFEDEIQSLQDALYHLNERLHIIEDSIEKIDNLIEEKLYYMQRKTKKDQESLANGAGQSSHGRLSPQAKTATTVTPKGYKQTQRGAGHENGSAQEDKNSNKYEDQFASNPSSFQENSNQEFSQKAGFYQCQLMFVDSKVNNGQMMTGGGKQAQHSSYYQPLTLQFISPEKKTQQQHAQTTSKDIKNRVEKDLSVSQLVLSENNCELAMAPNETSSDTGLRDQQAKSVLDKRETVSNIDIRRNYDMYKDSVQQSDTDMHLQNSSPNNIQSKMENLRERGITEDTEGTFPIASSEPFYKRINQNQSSTDLAVPESMNYEKFKINPFILSKE